MGGIIDALARPPRWASSGRRVAILALVLLAGAAVTDSVVLYVFPARSVPHHADVIVVFGGDDYRARFVEGTRLAEAGVAPYLLVSTTRAFVGLNRCETVPNVQVLCFYPEPVTTQGEAREVGVLAARYGWRTAVLVTTRFQATRARLRVSRCFDGTISLSPVSPGLVSWPHDLAYEWAATLKAVVFQRAC